MDPQVQNAAVAVGLVILGLLGLVVIWKITKSVLKLMFWLAALVLLSGGALWLLGEAQIIPRPATWLDRMPGKRPAP